MKTLLTIFALIPVITSCSNEPIKDIEYYLNHPEERKEKIAKCHTSAAKKDDQNCINAEDAEFKAMFKGDSMPGIK